MHLSSFSRVLNFKGPVGTKGDTKTTAPAGLLISQDRYDGLHLHGSFGEGDGCPGCRAQALGHHFSNIGRKPGASTEVDAVGGKIQGLQFDVSLQEETVFIHRNPKKPGCDVHILMGNQRGGEDHQVCGKIYFPAQQGMVHPHLVRLHLGWVFRVIIDIANSLCLGIPEHFLVFHAIHLHIPVEYGDPCLGIAFPDQHGVLDRGLAADS